MVKVSEGNYENKGTEAKPGAYDSSDDQAILETLRKAGVNE